LPTRLAQPGDGGAQPPVVTEKTMVLSQPAVQKTRVTEKAGTVLGAAQKDTAREIGAKLASLKGVVWIGVGLFVFGLVSLFYTHLELETLKKALGKLPGLHS
jgi:hypothetical protein